MGLICKLKEHNWGAWGQWEERNESLSPRMLQKIQDHPKRHIPTSYMYAPDTRARTRECTRCGRADTESELLMRREFKTESYTGHISAEEVHSSEELLEIASATVKEWNETWEDGRIWIPPVGSTESINSHDVAKSRDAPVEIGDYITGGVEKLSKHHSGGSDPLIRYEGFVIFVKASPNDIELGDKISVRITSFNKGNSANAVYIKKET